MTDQTDDREQSEWTASLRGDAEAYARLVRRYQPLITAQMWHFTRDPRVLEELVQDVFVEAYLSLASYRGDAPFLHWLRRIATRTGYRHWKRQSRERERHAKLDQWNAERGVRPDRPEPSEAAEYLFRLLKQLPARERLVLTLLYFEECGTEEIAVRMGWSRSLAKVNAFRARQKLKKKLEEAGYVEYAHK